MKKENWDFWGGDVLNETVYWIIWIGLKIIFFFIFAYVGGFVVLMLMSPVLAYASELTEQKTLGTDYPFNLIQLIKDIWRGVLIALRNLFIELFWMVLMFFFTFIPVVGWTSPIIMFFISSYYYGFSFLDYNNERKRLSVSESTRLIKKRKGIAIGVGALYAIFLLIPLIGPMLSGFAAIISTVSATLAYLEIEENSVEIIQ
jgi:CysZ protein